MVPTAVPLLTDVELSSDMLASVKRDKEFPGVARSAYSAFLGFQNSMRSKYSMSPVECVRIVNKWICTIGCEEPPSIEAKAVGKMGLKVDEQKGRVLVD